MVMPPPNEVNDVLPPKPVTPTAPLPPVLFTTDCVTGKQRYREIEGEGRCCINLPFWKSKLLKSTASPKCRANCGLLSIRFPVGLLKAITAAATNQTYVRHII